MLRNLQFIAVPFVVGAFVVAGCNRPSSTPTSSIPAESIPAKSTASDARDGEHEHKPTAHGGIIVPIGRDNYHAEAVFEKDGVIRFYTLGQDESKVIEVEANPLTAYAKAEGGIEATSFVFKAEPQLGDSKGKTSQFVGELPRDLRGKKVEVTIPTIRIGGERFRVGFSSTPVAHEDAAMPTKRVSDDERKLYLTPGGKYTEADIKANGGAVASVKFKGLKAQHDANPQVGDKLCPISMTKANPQFSWVVNGQTYLFCCSPCVDEFVQLAKDHPDQIKQPGEYVKK